MASVAGCCAGAVGAVPVEVSGSELIMKWITREKVKVDRVACPWLIRKFVDPEAKFLFVPAGVDYAFCVADSAPGRRNVSIPTQT